MSAISLITASYEDLEVELRQLRKSKSGRELEWKENMRIYKHEKEKRRVNNCPFLFFRFVLFRV